jgi:pyruvate formate lyase activating enzyme
VLDSVKGMKIGYFQKSSLIDYPGKISAIVFTQGCNFGCPYCHNPELVDPGRFIDDLEISDVLSFLEKRIGQLDAVVITGGEPTIHSDLIEFMETVKGLGYLIKLDTNGTNPGMVRKAIRKGIVDYLAMDIKAPLDKYNVITKSYVDTNQIELCIQTIMESIVPYEFRTTLSRSLLSPDDIISIGHMIKGARLYILQHFISSKHVDETFKEESSFAIEELTDLMKELNNLVEYCTLR